MGQLEALARNDGSPRPTIDAQLAATALHHGLTFVTRNTADIAPSGVPVFDPWR
jgi:predicted nucleic acid-binding protein